MANNSSPEYVEGEEVEILAEEYAGIVGKVVGVRYMYQIPVYDVHFPFATSFRTVGLAGELIKLHRTGMDEMLHVSVRELEHIIKATERAVQLREKRIINAYTPEGWAEARTMYEIDNARLMAFKHILFLHEDNK